MTPWGLRNKLKSALGRGGGPSAPSTSEEIEVRFVLPDGAEKSVRCEPRYSLVMASQTLETPIATGCPDGQCGTCLVDVLDGAGLAAPTSAEQRVMADKGVKPHQRLACHAKVTGPGTRVKVHTVWTMESTRGL